jgi:phage terminase small subunit
MALTPKQESFCLSYIETGNASEAYRRSYDVKKATPDSINRMAKALIDNVKIASRIDELKSVHVERHNVTVDTIRAMLLEDREFARELETPAAAVSATMGMAKLYGLLTDKTEHSGQVAITKIERTFKKPA